jgi:hypothetical protein
MDVTRLRAVLGSLTVFEAAILVVLAGLAVTGVLAGLTEPVRQGPCGVDECAQVAITHQQRWALTSRILLVATLLAVPAVFAVWRRWRVAPFMCAAFQLVAAWCVAFFIQVLTMPAWL